MILMNLQIQLFNEGDVMGNIKYIYLQSRVSNLKVGWSDCNIENILNIELRYMITDKSLLNESKRFAMDTIA